MPDAKTDPDLVAKIKALLDGHRLMTIATNRPDGWPQATTVGYANDGLTIYFLCGAGSQKAANLARDNRVSLTVDHDTANPLAITGLSMAARAEPVESQAEVARFIRLLKGKYPEYAAMPTPDFSGVRVFRLKPQIVSVLDYTQGFGHTDLVDFGA